MLFYKMRLKVIYCLMLFSIGLQLTAQSTTSDNPVNYSIEVPEIVHSGDQFTITVLFDIESGWFVYAPIDMNVSLGKIPTKATFKPPKGIKKIGKLMLPDTTRFLDTYRGKNVKMSQKFQVEKNTYGKKTILTNIVYQTCNDDICYPPVREDINVEITIN